MIEETLDDGWIHLFVLVHLARLWLDDILGEFPHWVYASRARARGDMSTVAREEGSRSPETESRIRLELTGIPQHDFLIREGVERHGTFALDRIRERTGETKRE